MRIIMLVLFMGLSVFSINVASAPITVGALSSNDDGSTVIISDSLNNIEWLRWDVLHKLTYAQTVEAVTNGPYKGWSFAGNNEALLFVNALHAPNAHNCTTAGNTTCSDGVISNISIVNGLVGIPNAGTPGAGIFFMSDNGVGQEVGDLRVSTDLTGSSKVIMNNEWGSLATSDLYSDAAPLELHIYQSWMLYRIVTPVPEPSAWFLMMIGMVGLLALERRKRA